MSPPNSRKQIEMALPVLSKERGLDLLFPDEVHIDPSADEYVIKLALPRALGEMRLSGEAVMDVRHDPAQLIALLSANLMDVGASMRGDVIIRMLDAQATRPINWVGDRRTFEHLERIGLLLGAASDKLIAQFEREMRS